MFTKSNHPLLYISNDCQLEEIPKTPYNIVLSPELYWVKKLTLPIKYLYQVKKLLPSIFEESLPQGEYSYHLYKQESEYIAFAYEDATILQLLASKGCNIALLGEVYFFQSLQNPKAQTLRIQNTTLLQKESLWITLPDGWVQQSMACEVEEMVFKEPVRLSSYAHLIDSAVLQKASLFLVLFSLTFFLQTYLIQRQNDALEEEKQKVFAHYSLKATTMQNQSMLKSYLELHERQMALRSVSAKILSLKLPRNSFISSYEFKAQTLHITFETKNPQEIQKLLKQSSLVYKSYEKEQSLSIEVSL